jgi:EAL domain-containing protein (putative c-di-GMP-specific phosphodiesterase class I)
VSRSIGLTKIVRQDDGSVIGFWAHYELRSAFQPIFSFTKGKLEMVAFEGLLRPFRSGEEISPAVFFPGIPEDERLNVETLSRTLHLMNAATFLPDDLAVYVNFDPSLFKDLNICDAALDDMLVVLKETGIGVERVVCEVTEQKSASPEALSGFVKSLKEHGFRVAVDDYGAEESDLQRIRSLSPDVVKFDSQWITRLMESGPGFSLLTTMVERFEAQGIRTVFEGIEENWQLELAEKSGASMVQGFVLARPALVPHQFRAVPKGLQKNKPVAPATDDGDPSKPGGKKTKRFGRKAV